MPLNILLADDSVPAQNMGKKILMDAGYGVVTVSNGLEALRKIGDAVPDIAILDIFMPGYTGLEICKRLRSSAATAAVPVILTVGKLEPYRPEDGEQVQSNAVIVKPFAAAELISAVRSLIGGPLAESQPGAAVEAELQSRPQPAMVEGDAPQQGGPTDEEMALLNPLAAHQAATAEPPVEVSQEEELDEPIFANAEFGVGGHAEPFDTQGTAQASSVYGGESLLAGDDPNGDASLAFDPDAKPTPFSASVIDSSGSPSATSSESQAAAGNGASGVGEFDLETESPAYSAPEPVTSSVEVGAASPQSPVAPEPIAFASQAMVELESSGSEFTALDPFVELPEALCSSGVSGLGILDAPEQNFSEFVAAGAEETDSAFNALQLSPEEEARREAFEALFNSPEPLPLDQVAVPASSADALLEDATDFVIPSATPFATQIEAHYEVQVSDPNPLEEAQLESETESAPPSVLEAIPEPLPELLDEALAPAEWSQTGKPETSQPIANAGDDIPTAPPPEAATREVAPAAVQQVCTEVDPEPSAADGPAPSAEILQAVPEPAQDASQAVREDFQHEAVPHETGTVPSEAVQGESRQPAPETATEIFVSALDLPLDDAGSELRQPQIPQQMAMSHPVEVAPLVSAPAVEEPLEPAPIDSEPEEPEPSMTAISSPPGVSSRLNEAERIHHAIELVFDRFKPLLVAAIVRELARND